MPLMNMPLMITRPRTDRSFAEPADRRPAQATV
jgi:hypothetical protein